MDKELASNIIDKSIDGSGRIVIITGEGCDVCEEIMEKVKDRKDIDIIYLTKDIISELVSEGAEVSVPIAMKDNEFCNFEVEDGKIIINCNEEKTEL